MLQSQLDAVRGEATQLRSAKSQVELQLSEQQLSEHEEMERAQTQLSSAQMQVRPHNLYSPRPTLDSALDWLARLSQTTPTPSVYVAPFVCG